MEARELTILIRKHGVAKMAEATTNPGIQVHEGWNLTDWRAQSTAGAVLFHRGPDAERILCVNADGSEAPRWRTLIANEPGGSLVTLLMAPGGFVTGVALGVLDDEGFQ